MYLGLQYFEYATPLSEREGRISTLPFLPSALLEGAVKLVFTS